MKIKNDYRFPEQYRCVAEEYVSYKRSMGFLFGYDDQKKSTSFSTISMRIPLPVM